MKLRACRWVGSIAVAVLLIACNGEPPVQEELTIRWTDIPDDVLIIHDAAAFVAEGDGQRENAKVNLEDAPVPLDASQDLRLFRYSEEAGLEEMAAGVEGTTLVANLTAGGQYILYPHPATFLRNRYQLICRFRDIRERVRVMQPDLIDPICTRILCAPMDLEAIDLLDEFTILENEFPEQFDRSDLADMPLNPNTGGTAPVTGDICDDCLGFNRFQEPALPHVIDCLGPPSGPRSLAINIINIIPNALSAETNQDSEPNVTVNPADRDQVVASAFTPNPAGLGNAPIFFSEDGGNTWALNPIVQSQLSTGDITVRFTRTTGTMYAGILRRPGGLRMSIQSTDDFTAATAMTVEVDRLPNAAGRGPDQPYVQANDVGGEDHVFVGNNDLLQFGGQGRTASIEQTVDDAANWTTQRIESRNTTGQDLPPVRPAIGPDDVIYAAFIARRTGGSEVVVVRDDDGATGATTFQDLTDADGQAGVRVVTGLSVPFENFQHPNLGQERLVASDLSIAVDPDDSSRVCVAWGDRVGTEVLTLHLRCSADSGATWTGSDITSITNAKNPALAFNSHGTLGFLYQAVTDGTDPRWVTHFERRADPSFALIDDTVLATTPANAPAPTFLPYIGDYVHLLGLGNTFYGIFSANNTPDMNNFPQGITYQREADFTTNELSDLAGDPVDVSIDPFFFIAEEGS